LLLLELLAGFVGGAYAYTTEAVENSDLSELAEMEKKSKDAKK